MRNRSCDAWHFGTRLPSAEQAARDVQKRQRAEAEATNRAEHDRAAAVERDRLDKAAAKERARSEREAKSNRESPLIGIRHLFAAGVLVMFICVVVTFFAFIRPLRKELAATKADVLVTTKELVSTKTELLTTGKEIAATRAELLPTAKVLTATQGDVQATNRTIDDVSLNLISTNQNVRALTLDSQSLTSPVNYNANMQNLNHLRR